MAEENDSFELILMVFDDPKRASDVLPILSKMEKEGKFQLYNTAIIYKDRQGITNATEPQDVRPWRGSIFGMLVGALVGLIGGPAGVVVGAAAGAVTGGAAARKIDLGFSDNYLKEVMEALQPDSSAILVLVEQKWVDSLVAELSRFEGGIFRHLMKADVVERLKNQQELTG